MHNGKVDMLKLFNKKSLKSVAAGVGIAVVATGAMAGTLSPSTANYSFSIEDKYNGTATRTLSNSGNTWTYNMRARVAGVATASQSSTFTLSGNTVIPSQASTTYRLFGVGRTHNIKFSNNGTQVASTYRGETTNLSAPNRAYDDLSLEVQIRQDLLSGNFTGNYYMVKKDKIESTPFTKVGSYSITVPAGTYDTVRIDRVHDDSSRTTSFWLAPSLGYLPIKIIQNNDGKRMELKLTSVQ